MAEDNSGNIKHDGIVPEQSVSGTPPALTATRDSMAWLFKNKFLRLIFNIVLAALICTAIYSIYIFTRHADPAEIFIFSAARYSPDKPFTVLVLARDAKAELPLQNQSIDLYMGLDGKELRKLPPVKTGADGIAQVPVSPCPAGKYQLKAVLRDLSAVSNFEVKSVYKSMLTSDKPMSESFKSAEQANPNEQMQSCSKYAERENSLIKIKMKFGNELFSYLLYASLILLVILSIPFLLVALNTGNNSYWMVISNQSRIKIQPQLMELQLMFCLIIFYIIFFISSILLQSQTFAYFLEIRYVLLLVVVIFALLMIKSVKSRNHIFEYCYPGGKNSLLKIILLIPWLYGVLIFACLIITLATIFFPNPPGIGLLCMFSVLSLIPVLGIWGIKRCFCTKEYLDLYCREVSSMGLGIGAYPRSFYSLWFLRGLHISPIIVIYLIIALVIISLFLPLCMIIDKLGK